MRRVNLGLELLESRRLLSVSLIADLDQRTQDSGAGISVNLRQTDGDRQLFVARDTDAQLTGDFAALFAANADGTLTKVVDNAVTGFSITDRPASDGLRVYFVDNVNGLSQVMMLTDLAAQPVPLPIRNNIVGLTRLGDVSYFAGDEIGTSHTGVFYTDGTPAGTARLLTLDTELNLSIVPLADRVIFVQSLRVGLNDSWLRIWQSLLNTEGLPGPASLILEQIEPRQQGLGYVGRVGDQLVFQSNAPASAYSIFDPTSVAFTEFLSTSRETDFTTPVAAGLFLRVDNENNLTFSDLQSSGPMVVTNDIDVLEFSPPFDFAGQTWVPGLIRNNPNFLDLALFAIEPIGFVEVNGETQYHVELSPRGLASDFEWEDDEPLPRRVIENDAGTKLIVRSRVFEEEGTRIELRAIDPAGNVTVLMSSELDDPNTQPIAENFDDPRPSSFIAFPADDPLFGIEAFVTDGTVEGTRFTQDLNDLQGEIGSEPRIFDTPGADAIVKATEEAITTDGPQNGVFRVQPDGTRKKISGEFFDQFDGSGLLPLGEFFYGIIPSDVTGVGPSIYITDGSGDNGSVVEPGVFRSIESPVVVNGQLHFLSSVPDTGSDEAIYRLDPATLVVEQVVTGDDIGSIGGGDFGLLYAERDTLIYFTRIAGVSGEFMANRFNTITGQTISFPVDSFGRIWTLDNRTLLINNERQADNTDTVTVNRLDDDGFARDILRVPTILRNPVVQVPVVNSDHVILAVNNFNFDGPDSVLIYWVDGFSDTTFQVDDVGFNSPSARLTYASDGVNAFVLTDRRLVDDEQVDVFWKVTADGVIDLRPELLALNPSIEDGLSTVTRLYAHRGSIFAFGGGADGPETWRIDLDVDANPIEVVAVDTGEIDLITNIQSNPDGLGPIYLRARTPSTGSELFIINDERAPLTRLSVDFSQAAVLRFEVTEPVADLGSVDILNLSTGSTFEIDSFFVDDNVFTYAPNGTRAPLLSGNYELRLGGVTDLAGNVSEPLTFRFDFFAGDLNGDRDVDLFDAAALERNFGRTDDPTYAQGDLDYDGDVDLFDAAILERNFGGSTPRLVVPSNLFALGPLPPRAFLMEDERSVLERPRKRVLPSSL
ncbi:MAG: dockerin type I domain-containing protein [Planctomycetota bacterium]